MDLNADMTFQWREDGDPGQRYLLKRTMKGKPMDRGIERMIEALNAVEHRRLPDDRGHGSTNQWMTLSRKVRTVQLAAEGRVRNFGGLSPVGKSWRTRGLNG
jgi:hypothetical protein